MKSDKQDVEGTRTMGMDVPAIQVRETEARSSGSMIHSSETGCFARRYPYIRKKNQHDNVCKWSSLSPQYDTELVAYVARLAYTGSPSLVWLLPGAS
jgi:hypothetical protein